LITGEFTTINDGVLPGRTFNGTGGYLAGAAREEQDDEIAGYQITAASSHGLRRRDRMFRRLADYKGFWVVGNLTAGTCEIVTSNPVMDNPVTSFSSGPYQSLDDAKLARSTIPQCPREPVASSK
jgi:hypothetical protein